MASLQDLSDDDLMALKAGDLTKVSNAGLNTLKAMRGAPAAAPVATGPRQDPRDRNPQLGYATVADEQDAAARAGPANAAAGMMLNTAIPAAMAVGGAGVPMVAGGALMAEVLRQAITSGRGLSKDRPLDAGEAVRQTAINAMPIARSGGMVANAAKNMAGQAVAGAAGEEARSLINDGQNASGARLAASAAIPAGAAAIAPVIGAMRGSRIPSRLAQEKPAEAAIIKAYQEAGGAVPPTAVNDTWINRRLEGWAGPARVVREANVKNVRVGQGLMKQGIGLPPDAELTDTVLDAVKSSNYQPYRKLQGISDAGGGKFYLGGVDENGVRFLTTNKELVRGGPSTAASINPKNPLVVRARPPQSVIDNAFKSGHDAIIIDNGGDAIEALVNESMPGRHAIYAGSPMATAADDLAALQKARADRNKLLAQKDNPAVPYDPAINDTIEELGKKADNFDDRLRDAASMSGNGDLMKEVEAARVMGGKINDIEDALNKSNRQIDLNKIGQLAQRGRPVSGPAKVVADFANATRGRYTRPVESLPNAGASGLEIPAALASTWLETPVRTVAGLGTLLARDPVRAAIVSGPGQRILANPYDAGRQVNPEAVATVIQALRAMLNGQRQ